MNAGKRNPTRARSGPDLAGGAGAGAPRGGRLFFRSVRDRAAVRPGRGAARRGRSVRLGLQPRRLCLLGAEGLRPRPCGAWMDLAPPAFPGLRRALSSHPPTPPSGPIPLSCPQPWLRENSVSKIFTSGAAVSDKKLPVSTTRRLQPTTDFNFLPLNTRYLFSGLNKKVPFLYSPTLNLPFIIIFGGVIFVFIFQPARL